MGASVSIGGGGGRTGSTTTCAGRVAARQDEPEGAAFALDAFDAELAVERGDDASRKGETDAGAFDIRRLRAEPFERQEEPLHLLG